jgi:glycosyltransferase involved in cell wall biosynthesis
MTQIPSVAIITRTKNRPLLLKRTIESVLNQTFQDWHMVIVNDGGDPLPVENLIGEYSERFKKRAKVFHHETSKGMEAASNTGIENSKSKYLVILDDDDTWEPTYLEETTSYLENNLSHSELGGVVTHWNVVHEKVEGNQIKTLSKKVESGVEFVSLYRMSYDCFIVPVCFLYKRAALEQVGGYDPVLKLAGDWDFNIRFLQKYEIGVIPRPLANYHKRASKKQKKTEYQNSVLETPDKLQYYANFVRNKYLRHDLSHQRVGMGVLMNISNHLFQLSFWHFIKTDLKKLAKKIKAKF